MKSRKVNDVYCTATVDTVTLKVENATFVLRICCDIFNLKLVIREFVCLPGKSKVPAEFDFIGLVLVVCHHNETPVVSHFLDMATFQDLLE